MSSTLRLVALEILVGSYRLASSAWVRSWVRQHSLASPDHRPKAEVAVVEWGVVLGQESAWG